MHPLAKPKIDLAGRKIGRLLVIEYSKSEDGRNAWVCDCDCGNRVEVRGSNLRTGKSMSCGCLKAERMAEGIGKNARNVRDKGEQIMVNNDREMHKSEEQELQGLWRKRHLCLRKVDVV